MENVNYCQCGCGEEIVIKPHHKYRGIPKYIIGHSSTIEENKRQSKVADIDLTQVLYCKCGCGGRITLRKAHKWEGIPEYISGHNSKMEEGRERARKLIKNIQGWNTGLTKETDERLKIISEKVSKTLKGRIISEEWAAKVGAANRGKIVSEETKLKISGGNKGKKELLSNVKRTQNGKKAKRGHKSFVMLFLRDLKELNPGIQDYIYQKSIKIK